MSSVVAVLSRYEGNAKWISKHYEELKKKFRAKSVDGTIRNLTMQAQGIPRSKFGAHSEMKPFTSEDEAKGHEL